MKNILVVDDEVEIVELLGVYLKNSGFNVFEAYNGLEALKLFQQNKFDIIILDIMMPEIDGIKLLKKIREASNIPAIFLSARNEDLDKIYGLGVGADDYISKPFNPLEVIARVQAILRRTGDVPLADGKDTTHDQDIVLGNLTLKQESCELYKERMLVELTSKEYKLLQFMMKNPGRVFTKEQLFEAIWGQEFLGDENIIMVYISKLRDKIEDNPKEPKYLKTIRGLGYRFERIKLNER